jgi:multiple sugar transport system permease protein
MTKLFTRSARRSLMGDIGAYAILIVVSLLFVIPIVWIFSTSLKPTPEILATPMTMLPRRPTFEHYFAAFGSDFRRYLMNSLIAATGSTAMGLALAIPAGFGFAKFRYPVSRTLLSFTVISRVFPPIALALPFFLEFGVIGLTDNPWGLAIAYVPIVLPLMIWMLHGFFLDFPDELLDAARMDGLNVFQTLFRVVIPLSLPGLGVAALFGFLIAWNEFIIALTLTRTPAGQTMPVGISTLITQFQVLWGDMMAVAAIYLLPVFVVTIVAQRGLVRGLMTGATKG